MNGRRPVRSAVGFLPRCNLRRELLLLQVSRHVTVFALQDNGLDARAVDQADEVVKMKSALSLMLVVCIVASALPVTAQDQTETRVSFDMRSSAPLAPTAPLSRAITREAVRLATAAESTTTVVETVQKGGTPARSDWSRVSRLTPGSEVVVTVKGSQPTTRNFVLADEADLVVLNLADPTIPRAATRVLLDLTSHHPEYFAGTPKAAVFVSDDVRVGRDGVFVAGRKIADLGQIVEHIAHDDVVEIKRLVRTGGSVPRAALWAAAGYFGGGMAGGLIGGAGDAGFGGKGLGGAMVGILVGAPIGTIWGAVHGYHTSSHMTDDLIYER